MALYELDGKRVVTPGAGRYWVAPSATVIGNVEIGEDASVWFGSIVRGDTDPGYPMTLGEGVTIGHMVMLHGCSIGRGALIGIGSIIMNGAEIGEECLIGSNTLIAEGKKIPPRSMVLGSPGKIIRTLSEEDVQRFGAIAGRYVANWQRFAKGMKPQAE